MNKKLLVLAVLFLLVSVGYYIYNNSNYNKSVVAENSEGAPKENLDMNVSTTTGTYTGIYNDKNCEEYLTLEIQPDGKAYMTSEPQNCKTKKEAISYDGNWKLENNLSLDLQDEKQNKFQNVLNVSQDTQSLLSTDSKYSFKKTVLKEYKSEFKNLVVEYGEFGSRPFARLWAPNGVLLATLYKELQEGIYENELYSWSVEATSSILTASTTEEIFTEQK